MLSGSHRKGCLNWWITCSNWFILLTWWWIWLIWYLHDGIILAKLHHNHIIEWCYHGERNGVLVSITFQVTTITWGIQIHDNAIMYRMTSFITPNHDYQLWWKHLMQTVWREENAAVFNNKCRHFLWICCRIWVTCHEVISTCKLFLNEPLD